MKHLRLFEEFNGHNSHWNEFRKFLSEDERYLSLFDEIMDYDEEEVRQEFMKIVNNENLTIEDKAKQITGYLDNTFGLFGADKGIIEYLRQLFKG